MKCPKNSIKRKRKQKKCEKIIYPLDKWDFFAYNNREIIEDRENAERESPHRERRIAESGARDGFGNAPVRCRCEAEGVFGGASDGCPPLAGRRYETYRKEIAHLYGRREAEWNREPTCRHCLCTEHRSALVRSFFVFR